MSGRFVGSPVPGPVESVRSLESLRKTSCRSNGFICLHFGVNQFTMFPIEEHLICSLGRTITCEGGDSNMRVVGRIRLEEFASQHADVRAQLDAWLFEVEEADWRIPTDVKARFPSASILSDDRVIFNVKGNRYRLEVKISYEMQTVLVTRVGTHAEYSKWKS